MANYGNRKGMNYLSIDYTWNDDKNLTLEMKGKYFDEGFDLYETLSTLNDLQSIFDKAYITITDKPRITKKDREIYRVKAVDIRKGSLVADITVGFCNAAQIAIPVLAHYSPSYLWSVTKEAFTYLKTVLSANKDGKGISLKNDGEGNVNIIIAGNNNKILFPERAYALANKVYDEFTNIAKQIDGENIKSVSLLEKQVSDEKNPIKIGDAERELFTQETKIEEKPTEVKGKIFRIDTHAVSGKMIVTESTDKEIEGSELSFDLLDENDIGKCCRGIEKEMMFLVLKKIAFDPISIRNTVKSLKIIKIK